MRSDDQSCWGAGGAVWDPRPPLQQWEQAFLSTVLEANNFWEDFGIDAQTTGVTDGS